MHEDRLTVGFLSGTMAAFIQNLISYLFLTLGWTDRTFSDFANVMIIFKPHPGFLAAIIGMIAHLTFGGALGYLFAFLVKNTSNKYYPIKVIIWGPFLWFSTLGAGSIFRLPLFTSVAPLPALMTLIGALTYSFINGLLLRYFDRKIKLV